MRHTETTAEKQTAHAPGTARPAKTPRPPAGATVRLGANEMRKIGVARVDLRDPYHLAVTLTWPGFFASLLALYLAINTVFAALYLAVPGAVANAHPGRIGDAFFFSIETLATVGYGEMYPASFYGHLVATVEIVTGLAFNAILTGLTFVRFSRPKPRFAFAEKPVVTTYDGKPTLMLRVGNARPVVLSDAQAAVSVLLRERTPEGHDFRRAHDLPLIRSRIPVFPLTWTLMHVIDEASPLAGFDAAQSVAADARLFVTVEARDPNLSAIVHDIRTYMPDSILFGWRYGDAVTTDEHGVSIADYTKISDVESDGTGKARDDVHDIARSL